MKRTSLTSSLTQTWRLSEAGILIFLLSGKIFISWLRWVTCDSLTGCCIWLTLVTTVGRVWVRATPCQTQTGDRAREERLNYSSDVAEMILCLRPVSYTVSTVTRSPPSEDIVSREQSELTQNILFNIKICGGSYLLIKVYGGILCVWFIIKLQIQRNLDERYLHFF